MNNEARNENYHERDETAVQQMRKEVASILKIQGFEPTSARGGAKKGERQQGEPTSTSGSRSGQIKIMIELKEPPTYIKILWKEDEEISFYPGQRRYIRVETDANSTYHDPNNLEKSKINIINSPGLVDSCGSTPLKGGRMRIIYECPNNSIIGSEGKIRVELRRSGLPTLSDEHSIIVIEPPSAIDTNKHLSLPPFEVNPVGPEDEMWDTLNWPTDENEIASSAIQNEGVLRIYYSTAYPKFAEKLKAYERRDAALVKVFTKKYEVWLVAHSLLLDHDKKNNEMGSPISINGGDSEQMEVFERKERCRIAAISTIFAEREVLFLTTKPSDE